MTPALSYAARSHTGMVRDNNEDSAYAAPRVLVLADGMGGYNAGEVASNMATTFIRAELGRWLREASSQASDLPIHGHSAASSCPLR